MSNSFHLFNRDNQTNVTKKKCTDFIKSWAKEDAEKLLYREFLPVILSLSNPDFHFEVAKRDTVRVQPTELLPYSIEYTLTKLLNQEIETCKLIEDQKNKLCDCPDFNVNAAFKLIDTGHKRALGFGDLNEFLKGKGANATPEDIVAILRRLDKDYDGKISKNDFVDGIS